MALGISVSEATDSLAWGISVDQNTLRNWERPFQFGISALSVLWSMESNMDRMQKAQIFPRPADLGGGPQFAN